MSQLGARCARPRPFHRHTAWGACALGGLFLSSACGYVGVDLSEEGQSVKIAGDGGAPPGAGGMQDGSGGIEAGGGTLASGGGSGGDSVGSGGADPSGTGGEDPSGAGGAEPIGSGGDEGVGGAPTIEFCPEGCEDYNSNFFFSHNRGPQDPTDVSLLGNGSFAFDPSVWREDGEGAIKFATELPGDEAEVNTSIELQTEGEIHFRAWILLPEALSSDWVKVFGLNGTDTDGPQVRIDKEGRLSIHLPDSEEHGASAANAYPIDEWFCLQIIIKIDDEEGAMDVRVNGASVLLIEGVDTKPDNGVRVIVYGLAEIGPGPSENLIYFDRVRAAVGAPPCDEGSEGSDGRWFRGPNSRN